MTTENSPPCSGNSKNHVSDTERIFESIGVGDALIDAGFGSVQVLSHEQADSVLTPARRSLIQALAQEDVKSVRNLAERVGRDPGNVSRDLKILAAENIVRLVKTEKAGSPKRPELKHDTIIQEPLVVSE